jgi:hypothetical protein
LSVTSGRMYQPAAVYRALGIRPFVEALPPPAP